jgi:hypothetical protein
MQKPGWSLLAAISVAALGVGPARADLGPFPAKRPIPVPEPMPERCTVALVRSVDHASIDRGSVPRIVARGTVPTSGWRDAALRLRAITGRGSRKATAVYDFVACGPVIAADVLTPITAETDLRTAARDGTIHRVLIKAAMNSTLVDLDARPRH